LHKNISIKDNPNINNIKGFHGNAVCCEIKRKDKPDLGIVFSEKPASVFALYTKNKFQAAPILVCKKHLKDGQAQALVANSGNANACTGEEGILNAEVMCEETAKILGLKSENVVVASTGVIGQNLPMDKIKKGIAALKPVITEPNDNNFSKAIMTTDTILKAAEVEVKTGKGNYRIFGTAKGSGMIHPNMATMLSFIFTDANIDDGLLEKAFRKSIEKSFNSITVDGDTSTNDTVMIFKNALADNNPITNEKSEEYNCFIEALNFVSASLAKKIVFDGEGATKLIEINVKNCSSEEDAKTIAMSVAKSSLVKTAFFGEDANWGRIICAVGYSGAEFDIEKVGLSFDDLNVFQKGKNLDFSEDEAKKILQKREIAVNISINSGSRNWTVWTSDLSFDYVKINASYRT
jgi:glutamate N-acetyltransferase / amino-acid N-acetyltransferase